MSEFYLVKDVAPGLDGLFVEGVTYDDNPNVVMVTRLLSTNMFVGDRLLSIPVAPHSMFISKMNLEKTSEPESIEIASDNPYGTLVAEGKMSIGDVTVSYGRFEKTLTVNVYDNVAKKTVYSQNYSSESEAVLAELENILKENGGSDVEDLVFKLIELKGKETNG